MRTDIFDLKTTLQASESTVRNEALKLHLPYSHSLNIYLYPIACVVAILLFDKHPDANIWRGLPFVVAGGLLVILRRYQLSQRTMTESSQHLTDKPSIRIADLNQAS